MTPAQTSDLIGAVYDCIQTPSAWPAVLERLCGALSAKAASVHVVNPIKGAVSLYVEYGTDPEWTALLMARYAAMSPIGGAVLLADLDQPVSAFDFIDEDEYTSSRFYLEWCKPQGYYDMLGALIAKRPSEIGAVSATRLLEKGRFGSDERALLGLIAPHVRRAVSISELLEQRANQIGNLEAIIDQLAVAVILTDAGGRVARSNAAAEELIATGAITVRDGRIVLASAAASSQLMASLAAGAHQPVMIPLPATDAAGMPLVAAIMTLDRRSGARAILLHAPQPELPALGKLFVHLFGFTPRETGIAMLLLEGKAAQGMADQLGVSLATIRTHLNKLLEKTGTSRQADLLSRLRAALPPVRG